MLGILICGLLILLILARCIYSSRRFLAPEMKQLTFGILAVIGVALLMGLMLAFDVCT